MRTEYESIKKKNQKYEEKKFWYLKRSFARVLLNIAFFLSKYFSDARFILNERPKFRYFEMNPKEKFVTFVSFLWTIGNSFKGSLGHFLVFVFYKLFVFSESIG